MKKQAIHARPHLCSVCESEFEWAEDARWFGSVLEEENGKPVLKFCPKCSKGYDFKHVPTTVAKED